MLYTFGTDERPGCVTCTSGLSSISGKDEGWVAGRCRNSILDTSPSMEPRRDAAMPSITPIVVASCCSDRYLSGGWLGRWLVDWLVGWLLRDG